MSAIRSFLLPVVLPLLLLINLALLASVISYGLLHGFGTFLAPAKLISKTTLVLLLLSLFPIKAWLNLSWQDLGFAPKKTFFRQLGQGLLLSLITLAPVLFLLYALDVQIWDERLHWSYAKVFSKISIALLLALLISLLEEPLFRGLLLTGLSRKIALPAAITTSAIYYAALHFLKSKHPDSDQVLSLTDSFSLVAEAFSQWLNPEIFSAFFALFSVGLFLAVVRCHLPNSLGLCIGCHAGWVWQIKISKDFFETNFRSPYAGLVSHYDGVVGPLICGWLLLATAAYLWWLHRNKSARTNPY